MKHDENSAKVELFASLLCLISYGCQILFWFIVLIVFLGLLCPGLILPVMAVIFWKPIYKLGCWACGDK
jgi:hypothetical protein